MKKIVHDIGLDVHKESIGQDRAGGAVVKEPDILAALPPSSDFGATGCPAEPESVGWFLTGGPRVSLADSRLRFHYGAAGALPGAKLLYPSRGFEVAWGSFSELPGEMKAEFAC